VVPKIFDMKDTQQNVYLITFLLLPVFLVGLILFNQVISMKLLHISFLDTARLFDGFYFAIILVSGVGIEQIFLFFKESTRIKSKNQIQIVKILTFFIVFIVMVPHLTVPLFSLELNSIKDTLFLKQTEEEYKLQDLWLYLKQEPEGRILFTHPSILIKKGATPRQGRHTHILSLTPIYTNREILGRTSTHSSPIAKYFYYGDKKTKTINNWAEDFVGKSVFGMNWTTMDETLLYRACRLLNVKTIVISKDEINAISFLNNSQLFTYKKTIGRFIIYDLSGYNPSYIDFDKKIMDALVIKYEPSQIDIHVSRANIDTSLILKIMYYPSWSGYINEEKIDINKNEIGLIKIKIPAGENYMINLRYGNSVAEKISGLVSIFSAFFILGSIVYLRFLKEKV